MTRQLPLNLRLKDSSSFENYLPAGNHAAFEHLRAAVARLARGDAHGSASPAPRGSAIGARGERTEPALFLHGPTGSGRTHLLQAACRAASDAGLEAMYVPLGEPGIAPALLEDLEGGALVCLDDVERIAGRPEWETVLFALVERLRAAGGMLVAAGTRPPAELGLRLPDLATRLGWGPVYRLVPLTDGEKLEAVRLRARNRGLELTEEVARYILARYPRDLDSLFGLLDRLDTAALVEQRRLTIPFLRSLEEKLKESL